MAASIGQSAVALDGETVGEVSDVITDESETVVGYLVDSGGFPALTTSMSSRQKIKPSFG